MPREPFSIHEILHTAYVLYDTWGTHIVQREDVKADREIHRAAEEIEQAMFDFYQLMGRISAEEEGS